MCEYFTSKLEQILFHTIQESECHSNGSHTFFMIFRWTHINIIFTLSLTSVCEIALCLINSDVVGSYVP